MTKESDKIDFNFRMERRDGGVHAIYTISYHKHPIHKRILNVPGLFVGTYSTLRSTQSIINSILYAFTAVKIYLGRWEGGGEKNIT